MVRILFITMQPFICLFFGKGVFCQSMTCQIMLCLLQGSFPDGDTAEDGYHGVAPVTAFPPQNNYGTQAYITKHYKQDRVLYMLNMTRYDVLSQDCMICWVMFGSGRLPVLLRLRSCMFCVERHGLTQLMDQPITGHVSPPGQFQLPLIKCSSNILFFYILSTSSVPLQTHFIIVVYFSFYLGFMCRMGNTPDSASDNLGFRCASDIKIKKQSKSKGKTEL